ncbi:hypothetical protein BS333_21320 (plasmid) [Vibrio azureus]|uniref:Uncharacterized protein n=1 Tax=Vibrio azureus NBRC 104587 TaxID=1219077 RepID=U3C427_9VIBR|nr:hypothetical protein [Vibrio azureus]AUI88923.1 hypothetical protein BS333_21320 [Vibrio azureus]GAD76189.1 hypothetical protein VAZ01S_039_00140 [Vibrio azureus NBRC 104587]
MLAFLKRWRQAYLEDKSNRLHAEAEAERNALCAGGISFDEAESALNHLNKSDAILDAWVEAEEQLYEDSWVNNYYEDTTRY